MVLNTRTDVEQPSPGHVPSSSWCQLTASGQQPWARILAWLLETWLLDPALPRAGSVELWVL